MPCSPQMPLSERVSAVTLALLLLISVALVVAETIGII